MLNVAFKRKCVVYQLRSLSQKINNTKKKSFQKQHFCFQRQQKLGHFKKRFDNIRYFKGLWKFACFMWGNANGEEEQECFSKTKVPPSQHFPERKFTVFFNFSQVRKIKLKKSSSSSYLVEILLWQNKQIVWSKFIQNICNFCPKK